MIALGLLDADCEYTELLFLVLGIELAVYGHPVSDGFDARQGPSETLLRQVFFKRVILGDRKDPGTYVGAVLPVNLEFVARLERGEGPFAQAAFHSLFPRCDVVVPGVTHVDLLPHILYETKAGAWLAPRSRQLKDR